MYYSILKICKIKKIRNFNIEGKIFKKDEIEPFWNLLALDNFCTVKCVIKQ